MYGASPLGLALCCRIAFFGALGPVGIGGSWDAGGVVGGVVARGVVVCPGEEENLEDMLDNHEFRRVFGDGDPDFGTLAFKVAVFSVEVLLEKPGLCAGIGLGDVEVAVRNGSDGS